MNVLIIVDDFADGAGNIAQILAMELNKRGYRVSMLLTFPHSKPRYDMNDVEIYAENFSAISNGNKVKVFVNMIKKMRHLIVKETKAELVISFLDNNNSLACMALWDKQIPIIVSERSNPLAIYPKFPWNYIRRIAYRRADIVTVQFDEFKKFEGSRFEKKCFVTSNIVNEPSIHKEYEEGKTIKFVTMGRLAKIKRLDLMIELFSLATEQIENIELYIYGVGPEEELLREFVRTKKLSQKVFFKGYSECVYEELIKYDVYLMTSLQEGFPNSLSEAMAVGLPSISFECHKGIAELMQYGKAGFIVSESDKEGFVEKMLFLARNGEMRKKVGEEAKKITVKYAIDKVMEQWERCIEEARKKQSI